MSDPLVYFITFRTYGTWLGGDERGTVDRWHNIPGRPRAVASPARAAYRTSLLRDEPGILHSVERTVVDAAIRETCAVREWPLLALNVRTNHVHVVLWSPEPPEKAMNMLKAYSTRALRREDLRGSSDRPWARHGSTRHLFRKDDVDAACAYVTYGQD